MLQSRISVSALKSKKKEEEEDPCPPFSCYMSNNINKTKFNMDLIIHLERQKRKHKALNLASF